MKIDITPELCEFVGAIMGDGNLWTDGSRYRISMVGHPILDKPYLTYLWNQAYNLFGKYPYRLRVRSGGLRFTLQQKDAFQTLVNLGIHVGDGKAKCVVIPKAILNKGWKFTKWTIRGIYDTDGTVFVSKKTYKKAIYPTVEITTISRGLANQLGGELVKHGFRAHVRRRIDHRSEYNSDSYIISIYGHEMLNMWFTVIGSSNKKHLDKWLKYKNLYKG